MHHGCGITRKRRGASLAFILVVSTLAFLAAFVLAGMTSAHLGFANKTSHRQRAGNLAHAAVQKALAHLQTDPDYGLNGETLQVSLSGDPSGSSGFLTFEPSRTGPYSTHNFNNQTSRPGYQDRVVPPNSIHLVATGRCANAERLVEVIVTLPPFPYAIASAGPIESSGDLLVGTLDGTTQAGLVTPEDLLPAHLASNYANENSIVLGPDTTIMGDVRSAGGLKVDQTVVIKGQALAYGQPVALPEIPLDQFDPALGSGSYQRLPGHLVNFTLNGTARRQGDLVVFGDLDLDNGKLYVEGRLTAVRRGRDDRWRRAAEVVLRGPGLQMPAPLFP